MRDIKKTYMNNSYRCKLLAILVPILAILTLGAAQIYPNLVLKGKPWHDVRAYTTAASAVTAIGSVKAVLVINGNVSVSDNLTIPSNVTVKNFGDGNITTSGSAVLRINGPFESPSIPIFKGTKAIKFGVGSVEKVDLKWFGAALNGTTSDTAALLAAYNSLPTSAIVGSGASGGTLYHPGGILKANLTVLKDNTVMRCPESGWLGGEYEAQEQGTYWIADDVDSPVIQVGNAEKNCVYPNDCVTGFRLINCSLRGGIYGQAETGKYGLYLYAAYQPSLEHVSISGFTLQNLWQRFSYLTTCDYCQIVASNVNPSTTVRQDLSSGAGISFKNSWLWGSHCQDQNASITSTYNAACSDGSYYLIKGAESVSLDNTYGEVYRPNHGIIFDLNGFSPISGSNGSYIEAVDTLDGLNFSQKTVVAAYNSLQNYPWGYMVKGSLNLFGAYKRADGTIENDASIGTDLINFGSVSNDFTENTFRYSNWIAGLTDNDTRKTEWNIRKNSNDLEILHGYQTTNLGKLKYTPYEVLTGNITGGFSLFDISPNFRSGLDNHDQGYSVDVLSYLRPVNPVECSGNCTITDSALVSIPAAAPWHTSIDYTEAVPVGSLKVYYEDMGEIYHAPLFASSATHTWGNKLLYELTDNMTVALGGAKTIWPAYTAELTTPKKRLQHAVYHRVSDLYACGGNCTIDEGNVFWFSENPLGTHKATTNVDKTKNTVLGTFKVLMSDNTTTGHVPIYSDSTVIDLHDYGNSTTMQCNHSYYASTGNYVFQLPAWQINCPIKIRPYNNMSGRIWLVPSTGEFLELPAKTAYGTANQMLKSGGLPTDYLYVESGGYSGYWDIWLVNGNWTIQGP